MDVPLILLYTFAVFAAIQGVYYLFFLRFAWAKKPAMAKPTNLPITVIVVGRNEAENFRKHLPLLCKQDYPNFEVLAVNDQSVDESKEVIEELMKEYPNLRMVDVVENDRFWLGKKYGLTLGIKGAMYENLLLTDADCIPVSEHWITEMAQGFEQGKELVLGFGAYQIKSNFINFFVQYETLLTAVQYFSWALLKMPYMGVGRNMGYTRDLFFKNKGFVEHMHIPSGDDDLFVQQAATAKNTKIVFSANSHTLSIPKNNFKDWIRQKQRHFKTSKHYKPLHKFVLGLFGVSQMLFYLFFVLALILTPYKTEVLVIFGVRLILQYLVFTFAALKLGSLRILWLLPILEIGTWFIQAYTLISASTNKKKRW